MSEQMLPSGLKFGDGLGDFINFTSDGGQTGPASQHDAGNDGRRRDFRPADGVSAEDSSFV
jgi:hypothetical protein